MDNLNIECDLQIQVHQGHVRNTAAQMHGHTVGAVSRVSPSSPDYFGRSFEHSEPPLKKTRMDIEIENFMKEYMLHKAEREAAKANKKKLLRIQRGRRVWSNQKSSQVASRALKVADTLHQRQIPLNLVHETPLHMLDNNFLTSGACNIEKLEMRNVHTPRIFQPANSSHSNQVYTNVPHHPSLLNGQHNFLIFGGQDIWKNNQINNQANPGIIENFNNWLIEHSVKNTRNNYDSVIGQTDVRVNRSTNYGIIRKNHKRISKQVNITAGKSKVDGRARSNSSGGDSGRYTTESKDHPTNLSFENEQLRSTIQYGPQLRLRKYTFLVDDSLLEDFVLDRYDTPSPVVRMSRAKYNWIFLDRPQMSRKFSRGNDPPRFTKRMEHAESQATQKQYNASGQRQRNRVAAAIADIEEHITKTTTLEKMNLIIRYRAFKNILRVIHPYVNSMQQPSSSQ